MLHRRKTAIDRSIDRTIEIARGRDDVHGKCSRACARARGPPSASIARGGVDRARRGTVRDRFDRSIRIES
ncbi:hypothetical protein BE221DRAFT_54876, partial [Ostreococcus tauri]